MSPKKKSILPLCLLGGIILIAFVSIIPIKFSSAVSPSIDGSNWTLQTASPATTTVSIAIVNIAGDTLIAEYYLQGSTSSGCNAPVISDTFSNVYTRELCIENNAAGGLDDGYVLIWKFDIPTSQSGDNTIQVFDQDGTAYSGLYVLEVSGISGGAISTSNGTSNNAAGIQVSSFALKNGITFAMAFPNGVLPCAGGCFTYTLTSGFTEFPSQSGGLNGEEYALGQATSPNTLAMTFGGSAYQQEGAISIAFTGCCKLISTTYTQTITGWVFPNFVAGNQNYSWFYGILVLLGPVGFIDSAFVGGKKISSENIDSGSLLFLTLIGLLIGSIIGVTLNWLPFAVPFVFAVIFGLYLWKGRG